ncbi:MAG TPA: hypothetical protein VGJ51_03185, partial [Candidatus Angelobacter sp.]
RLKAFFVRLVPKVGPFSALAFHPPTPAVEQMYMHSFNETLALYQKLLAAQGEGKLLLPNDNLDTGGITEAGVYRPADKSYATLLAKLDGKPVSDDLRRNILAFYADLGKPFVTKKNPREWKNVLRELDTLKAEEKTRAHAQLMPIQYKLMF